MTGLVGLEVFYSHYSSDTINRLLVMARERELVLTAGSDFRGLNGESIQASPETALLPELVDRLFILAERDFELEKFKTRI